MQGWQRWVDTIIISKMNDEITIIQIGNLYPDTPKFKNRTAGRVYDINGCCPTINTNGGGGQRTYDSSI
jgi:hypothetical protein